MRELDEAYANSRYIPDGDGYYARWETAAAAFRAKHPTAQIGKTGEHYAPKNAPRGTVVFVHGGYWMAGSASMFSHLAAGAVDAGLSCVVVSYTLAPALRIAEITRQISERISQIARASAGPLYLVGHSAGAHLVARMACSDMASTWSQHVARVMAISPIGDLAPLMQTSMNETLGLDPAEALRESPIHHPRQDMPVTVWVGGEERPAFIEQAENLSRVWDCDLTIEAGRHHFDVIEGLERSQSAIMRALFS